MRIAEASPAFAHCAYHAHSVSVVLRPYRWHTHDPAATRPAFLRYSAGELAVFLLVAIAVACCWRGIASSPPRRKLEQQIDRVLPWLHANWFSRRTEDTPRKLVVDAGVAFTAAAGPTPRLLSVFSDKDTLCHDFASCLITSPYPSAGSGGSIACLHQPARLCYVRNVLLRYGEERPRLGGGARTVNGVGCDLKVMWHAARRRS